MRYAVAIHKDEDSDYGVSVPDLPGCFSAGDTLDDAMNQVVEAIETHIEGLMIDGEPVPAASEIEALRADENYADATWAVVDVDISRLSGKTRRINITMTERLLSQLDEAADRAGGTRSGLLADAVMEYLRKHRDGARC